jgi:SOS response regulatory protein OraA/RecX
MDMEKDDKLMDYALRLTSRAEYTCSQVKRKLLARGASESRANEMCSELVSLGFVDDIRYCGLFVSSHPEFGFSRLKMELLKRGVERAVVESSISLDEESELSRAVLLAREWAGFTEPRKIAARLSRRGFSARVIVSAIRRACDTSS